MLIKTIGIAKIMDLKHKGKIMDNFSANLIGVIDETGILKEGEVYVSLKKDNFYFSEINACTKKAKKSKKYKLRNSPKIIEGNLIVTKNPCLHPGDVKLLKAVNPLIFISFSFNKENEIKKIAIGDFQMQEGQSLIFAGGFLINKSTLFIAS